jgi:hypothetical protein
VLDVFKQLASRVYLSDVLQAILAGGSRADKVEWVNRAARLDEVREGSTCQLLIGAGLELRAAELPARCLAFVF